MLTGERQDPAGFDDPDREADYDLEGHWRDQEEWEECEEPEHIDPITCSAHGVHRFAAEGKAVWDSPLCPRCQQQAEESTFHQFWECPHNEDIAGTHLEFLEEDRMGHKKHLVFGFVVYPHDVDLPAHHEAY